MKNSTILKNATLIAQMTLYEKASLLSGANFWNTKAIKRLDVPSIMLTDGPHGVRKQGGKSDHLGLNKSIPATCFPTAATLANSWDMDLLEEIGTYLGKEAVSEKVNVLLGPGLNIKRNPLCGRNFEYFSEDPLLSGKLASALVKGIQKEGVSACPKHFIANSQETHRMIVDEVVDERALHEIYLEGFRYAITEGEPYSLMTSYNKINGVYSNESTSLLQDIVVKRWGYKGLIVTDWGGSFDRLEGLKAGNTLEMPSTDGATDADIIRAVNNGEIQEKLLDERVDELLTLIQKTMRAEEDITEIDYPLHHQIAIKAASNSIVLLKNKDNILPIEDQFVKIGVIGDFAKTPRYQGAGSSKIEPTKLDNLLEEMNHSKWNIIGYEKGFKRLGGKSNYLLHKAKELAKKSDYVILFLGLDEGSEAEGIDRSHLQLNDNQIELVNRVHEINENIIVVLAGGSPIEMPFIDKVKAIVHGYLPGQGGGVSLWKILIGEINPSGKLTETYPLSYRDVGSSNYYPGKQLVSEHRESIYIGYRYYDKVKKEVLFPFGYGLSYTTFRYDNLVIENNEVTLTVQNTGNRVGKEIVQVYVKPKHRKVYHAIKELKGFLKVHLQPGETKQVRIQLDQHAFAYYSVVKHDWVIENGQYEIQVGSDSRNILLSDIIDITNGQEVYDPVKSSVYDSGKVQNITSNNFEELLERKIPVSVWDESKKLDRNDIIEQVKHGGLFGKMVFGVIVLFQKALKYIGKPIASNNVMFIRELPLRSVSRMSGGKVDLAMLDALIQMLDGEFFKGLIALLKAKHIKNKMKKYKGVGKVANRKEIKAQVKVEYSQDKEYLRNQKLELQKLTKEERKIKKRELKVQRKEVKKQRKSAINNMAKVDRKVAKKHDKFYKKLKTRPRRYSIKAVIVVLLVIILFVFGPLLGDIGDLLSIDLTSGTPEANAALLNGEKIAQEISDEGIVLLKNDNSLLPLDNTGINIFGLSSVNFKLSGGGSGGSDQTRSFDLYQGFTEAGVSFNQDLHEFYKGINKENEQSTGILQVVSSVLSPSGDSEPTIDYLTDEMMQNAKEFSDVALIVLSGSNVEAMDAKVEQLKLSQNQIDLLDRVSSEFDDIIIILNSGNAWELGFIEEYTQIKAVLWVGLPGVKGTISLGNTLQGELNPSGRLVDTYVYNIEDHPSIINLGDYTYENLDGMGFLNYEEGIYVGYRFFETYYQDDEVGYQETVIYPFGYGLSYTDFSWEIENYTMNENEISIDVKVTNTGEYAGKDVVQVYFSAPYTPGGIEKSAIELAAYGKTDIIEPGAFEIISISYDTRDMSSYDMDTFKAFVLESGTYDVYISKNVHESVLSYTYEVTETVVYTEDDTTGTAITNLFDYANGGLSYLSRNDWSGTFPNESNRDYTASDELIELFNSTPEKVEGTVPTMGAENDIMLEDLKGLDYDDPLWQDYLDQFTFDEMNALINNGGWRTIEVERLGLPSTILLDGPAGINNFFKPVVAASYPTEIVIASTWNEELAYKIGEAIGIESNAYGVNGWYAPAVNIHRSPLGGRNFEYFSEDPLLSGRMGAQMIKGAQSKDIIVFLKHYALNEQEINARAGVLVWANEQSLRELYLRPFEISVKEGGATGVMSSFIHIGHKWAGGNEELLEDLLREEWGFEGIVSTDAVIGGFMDVNLAIRYGNDLMLNPIPTFRERALRKAYKNDPVGVVEGLRERTHNISYTILNQTDLVE